LALFGPGRAQGCTRVAPARNRLPKVVACAPAITAISNALGGNPYAGNSSGQHSGD
jgi:hypothetical protein